MRIIVDTNIWISYLLSRPVDLELLLDLIGAGRFKLVASLELKAEFLAVAQRPKFAKRFTVDEATEFIELLFGCADVVEVNTVVELCRDSKDNFLLSLAVDGKADFLLTGDADLLILSKLEATKIMTYKEFLLQYGRG